MSEANARAPLLITCVHGTWGRGFFARDAHRLRRKRQPAHASKPRWFESGSTFQQALTQALEAQGLITEFDHFQWSGDNSILQRDQAGKALAELIRGQSERFPGHTKVIIAHSHGGNVAMRALHRLRDFGEIIRVITLATPFVQVFPPDESDAFTAKAIASGLSFLSVPLVLLGSIGFLFGVITVVAGAISVLGVLAAVITGEETFFALAVPAVKVTIGAALLFIGFRVADALGDSKREAIARWLVGPEKQDRQLAATAPQLCMASAIPATPVGRRKFLVLRGVDDEAAFALASGAIGARLSRILIALLNQIARYIHAVRIIALIIGMLLGYLGSFAEPAAMLIIWGALAYVFAVPILTIPAVAVCCAFKSVHGRELLHGSLFMDVVSHSAPDCVGNLDVLTLRTKRPPSGWFRHSLHAHPDVSSVIAMWFCLSRECPRGKECFEALIDGYDAFGDDRLVSTEEEARPA